MKTEVILKRELEGKEVRQSSKTGFFCVEDIENIGNISRIRNNRKVLKASDYFRSPVSKEFIEELTKEVGIVITDKGQGRAKWVHPYLFIDIALWYDPKLKIHVYKWIMDELVKYRNTSGDSYKKMIGALFVRETNKTHFKDLVINTANKIKEECGVINWETATEDQLKLRNKIHEYIYLLSNIMTDINSIIEVSIKNAKDLEGL